jgi:hypothetical protein
MNVASVSEAIKLDILTMAIVYANVNVTSIYVAEVNVYLNVTYECCSHI